MKMLKQLTAMLLVIALAAGCAAAAAAAKDKEPEIILYTVYQNLFPDGLRLQAGVMDDQGGLWTLDTVVPDYDGSVGMDEYLSVLLKEGKLAAAGKIDRDTFDVKSLIISAEDQGNETEAVCEGAGCESSYAIERDWEGNVRKVLLGVSGDSRFENTDSDAQALYLLLRETFPEVENYAWSDMGPRGFSPVSIIDFCGWQDIDFNGLAISCADIDCEAGLIPVELNDADRERVLKLVTAGNVTGKANATMISGGMTEYWFEDENGKYICGIQLYDGLMVMDDGMWYVGD